MKGASPARGKLPSTTSGRPLNWPSASSASSQRLYVLVSGVPAPKQASMNHKPPGRNSAPTRSAPASWPLRPKLIAPWRARCSTAERQPRRGAPSPWLSENRTLAGAAASRSSSSQLGSSRSPL